MSSGWTPERRAMQSASIHRWKPWKTAGVKTAAGKAISRMNAYKHGARSTIAIRLGKTLSRFGM